MLWVARGDYVLFHDWNSVGWHVATTCHLRRLFVFLCISGGTYIYVPKYVHTIEKHDLLNKVIILIVSEVILAQFYFLFDGPGMSFVEGIVCPQASQTCCDKFYWIETLPRLRKTELLCQSESSIQFRLQKYLGWHCWKIQSTWQHKTAGATGTCFYTRHDNAERRFEIEIYVFQSYTREKIITKR